MSKKAKTDEPKYTIFATIEKIEYDDNGKVQLKLRGCDKHIYEKKDTYYTILENSKGTLEVLEEKTPIYIQLIGNDIPYIISHAFLEKKKLKFELKEQNKVYHIVGLSHAT